MQGNIVTQYHPQSPVLLYSTKKVNIYFFFFLILNQKSEYLLLFND